MSKKILKKNIRYYSKTITLFIISLLFISCIFKEISITYNLKHEYVNAIEKQELLKKETMFANEKKEKLQNDDYLLIYAKGKYYMSENENDQIFVHIQKK